MLHGLATVIEIVLLDTSDQCKVGFLANVYFTKCPTCQQNGISARSSRHLLHAIARLQCPIKALDDWTRRSFLWLEEFARPQATAAHQEAT